MKLAYAARIYANPRKLVQLDGMLVEWLRQVNGFIETFCTPPMKQMTLAIGNKN